MVIKEDPVTRQRIVASRFTGPDIVYKRTGASTSVTSEDVFITQARNASGLSREQQMWQGITNSLWGTEAWLDGTNVPNLTERGNNKDTTITQQVETVMDLNGNEDRA